MLVFLLFNIINFSFKNIFSSTKQKKYLKNVNKRLLFIIFPTKNTRKVSILTLTTSTKLKILIINKITWPLINKKIARSTWLTILKSDWWCKLIISLQSIKIHETDKKSIIESWQLLYKWQFTKIQYKAVMCIGNGRINIGEFREAFYKESIELV